MEEQIQQSPIPEKPKRKYWKFVAVFFGIMIIIAGGFFVGKNISARRQKSTAKRRKIMRNIWNGKEIMKRR